MPNTPHIKSGPNADRNLVGPATAPTPKLSVQQAATHLGVSKSWLDKRRLDGNGPRYLKFSRRVCYDLADLEAYAASRRRAHTSESANR
jgi:predicted DNA-binding transcriptional regulator AlpA